MQSTMELGDNVRVETCTGQAIVPLLPELQRLRVTVFRAWPYLYDGDPAQEAAHLRGFVDSAQAAIVVAFGDGAFLGLAILDELDPDHQALAAHVADDLMLVHQRPGALDQERPDVGRVGDEALAQQLDRRHGRGAADRVSAKRAGVRPWRPVHHFSARRADAKRHP